MPLIFNIVGILAKTQTAWVISSHENFSVKPFLANANRTDQVIGRLMAGGRPIPMAD
jgi:hypothetical protein